MDLSFRIVNSFGTLTMNPRLIDQNETSDESSRRHRTCFELEPAFSLTLGCQNSAVNNAKLNLKRQ